MAKEKIVKTVSWKCPDCGFTSIADFPPVRCPKCNAMGEKFVGMPVEKRVKV